MTESSKKFVERGLFDGPEEGFAKANDHTDKRRARCGMLGRGNVEAVLWAVRRTMALVFVRRIGVSRWMKGIGEKGEMWCLSNEG